jgi:predicted membrane protein
LRFSRGRIVVGAILIIAGIGWLLDTAGFVDIPLRALLPVALIVIGIALVVEARRGSHSGLIVAGAVITLILATSSTAERSAERIDFGDRVGENVERPRTANDLHPYRLDAGNLTIDLTKLVLSKKTYHVSARVQAGRIDVLVPAGVPLHIKARSGVGSLRLVGNRRSGVGVRASTASPNYRSKRPRIDLNLRVGVGSIQVTRERSARGSV